MDNSQPLVKIILPWPPSINHYWRRNGARYFVSAKGNKYRNDVILLSVQHRGNFSKESKLIVSIEAYPPDKRKRDLDNILKSLLDSLQHAGVYHDDCQIDKLSIQRYTPLIAQVHVTITELNYQGTSSS